MCDDCYRAWELFQEWQRDYADRHPDDDRDDLALLEDPVALADWRHYAAPEE